MKISKKSWHYLTVDMFCRNCGMLVPDNLCQYFWILAIGAIVLGVTACGVSFLAGMIIYAIAQCWQAVFVAGFFLSIVALGSWVGKRIAQWMSRPRTSIRAENKPEPGLFSARYKAFKDKACPILEFTEE